MENTIIINIDDNNREQVANKLISMKIKCIHNKPGLEDNIYEIRIFNDNNNQISYGRSSQANFYKIENNYFNCKYIKANDWIQKKQIATKASAMAESIARSLIQ